MILEFNENTIDNLKASTVTEWYSEHHTEQDLADVYELVHRMWVYYEDCTYDYDEDTPEYREAVKSFEEWNELYQKLENDIFTALRNNNINVEILDINALNTFMGLHGYVNHGGWFIKE